LVVWKNTTIFALSINNLKLSIMKKVFLFAVVLFAVVSLSSCFRGGYGCKGNSRSMTGEGMHKRGSRLSRY
jgi:hypothetical protein